MNSTIQKIKPDGFKDSEIGKIPEDWEVKPIEYFCSKITSGGTPSRNKDDFWINGTIPWVKTQELLDCNIYSTDEKITSEGLKNSSARLMPINTVSMAMYGATVGKLGIFRIEATTNQACCNMVVDSTKSDFRFLFYALLAYRSKLISLASGAAQQNLNQDIIKNFELPFPYLPEQRAIAKVLSDLDAKIELNREMNATLEKMAEALFKHWFVDFEFPNEKGKPYKSSGGEMVKSELGMIPEGWKIGTLGEICEITMGQSPPGETYNKTGAGLPFYQGISDFGFRSPSRRVYCTAPTRFAEEGDVLLSVRAPVGSLNVAEERCAIGRGVAALRSKGKPQKYIYYLLRATQSGWNKFEAEGTVFGSVGKSDVHGFKVVLPPEHLRERFGSFVEPVDRQITINEKKSHNLAAVRDSLLPKLMSGQIRVPL